MSAENVTLVVGATLLATLPITALVATLVSAAHNHDVSVFKYCTCFLCLLAYKLDRHHGRHRLEDHYLRQRRIRADFHLLTPDS
ncbi:hypothetical protein [Phytomonospora endophytica]|uniref:Uncharacterized protein n=1 Tax=Phytomonospora endophytica TaxID=714109 RepID=A0A841G0F6_9ACTN|nr:hypothetical protein [Phytomonospora endophytica]MBB6037650.1 hypothetical protein [Phytomonospora endophytica]GIG67825.1 hypothetical protein Pen01_41200 [Phytomonospora endophytica]